jgi:protein-L-isoaspartate O-methyltransferase
VNLPDSAILNNLYMPGITRPDTGFEKKYIACRSKERRMYSDEEVRHLPGCAASSLHYKEWMIRKASADRLCTYLENKKKALNILEIGCGNGWLAHRLSRAKLIGLDINFTELQQAARVFNNCHKIKFMYGDLRSGILKDREFDIIVFAASIQYFPSLDEILELSLEHLGNLGEIHITDTMFYPSKEIAAAKKRSEAYFATLGLPEMADHYFHHSLQSLAPFNHTVMYDPHSLLNRFRNNRAPFHWIRINKDQS